MRNNLLLRLALPLLALSAAYGVYAFQLAFWPPWVALLSAAAFELVYLGLAFSDTADPRARRITAIGAVIVSGVYNSVNAAWHLDPSLLASPLPLAAIAALALLHGSPLALVAYSVASLLHRAPAVLPEVVELQRELAEVQQERNEVEHAAGTLQQEYRTVQQERDQLQQDCDRVLHEADQSAAVYAHTLQQLRHAEHERGTAAAQVRQLEGLLQERATLDTFDDAEIAAEVRLRAPSQRAMLRLVRQEATQ